MLAEDAEAPGLPMLSQPRRLVAVLVPTPAVGITPSEVDLSALEGLAGTGHRVYRLSGCTGTVSTRVGVIRDFQRRLMGGVLLRRTLPSSLGREPRERRSHRKSV